MIPYRCMNRDKTKGRECGRRKSMKREQVPDDVKCSGCGSSAYWAKDAYRIEGRKNPNKDHPERCDCHGGKAKKEDKIVERDGVSIVLGPHRKGQKGCMHNPEYGKPDPDQQAYYDQLEIA